MDIPFPLDVSASDGIKPNQSNRISFDNGTTDSVLLSKMAGLIPPLPVQLHQQTTTIPFFILFSA